MQFCTEYGSAMVKVDDSWACRSCEPAAFGEPSESSGPTPRSASLEQLETTASGSVKKADVMEWMKHLDRPSKTELRRSIVEKPNDFSGSTYAASVSNIRFTGDPTFIETVAGLFKPILDLEDDSTRVELNLQQVEDRDTGEMTDNYALYLSVAERG